MVSNNKILGNYITRVDRRNVDKRIRNVMGISVRKEFRVPTSKVNPNELSTYKIVEPGQFAFVQTTHNEKCFAFAYNDTNKQIVVSSVNEVFYVDEKTNEKQAVPDDRRLSLQSIIILYYFSDYEDSM